MSEETRTHEHSKARELAIGAGSFLVALALPMTLLLDLDKVPFVIMGLSMASVLAWPMARRPELVWQVASRAIWWQGLVLGLIILGALVSDSMINEDLWPAALMLITGGAMAIGAAGRIGMDSASERFVPVAFRSSLIASLVMAMADTIALLFYAGITIEDRSYIRLEHWVSAGEFAGVALVMSVAIYGLYRLKLWGLGLNIVANIVIAACALGGVFEVPNFFAYGLTATAAAQLLIPLPLIRRMVASRGRRIED